MGRVFDALIAILLMFLLFISCKDNDELSLSDVPKSECVPLPTVMIETPQSVAVESKTEWTKNCKLTLLDPNGELLFIDTAAQIRCRGNSTYEMPKKPYALKLSERIEVLGMRSHRRWCLLANAFDRTHLKNDVAFHIGKMTALKWTPCGQFVVVSLNGKEQGLYYLCEQIKVDTARLALAEIGSSDVYGEAVTGGYLLEYDKYFDGVFKFRTAVKKFPVNIKSPDEDIIKPIQAKYIVDYVNHVESLLYVEQSSFEELEKWMDMDSFADYYLVSELTFDKELNRPRSVFLYKDRGGRLSAGPIWDYDWAWCRVNKTGLALSKSLYYDRLLELPDFITLLCTRWSFLRSSLDGIGKYIEEQSFLLRGQSLHDRYLWQQISKNSNENLEYDEAVGLLIRNFSLRVKVLDAAYAEQNNSRLL